MTNPVISRSNKLDSPDLGTFISRLLKEARCIVGSTTEKEEDSSPILIGVKDFLARIS